MWPEWSWKRLTWDAAWSRTAIAVWLVVLLTLSTLSGMMPRRHSVLPIYTLAGANWLRTQPLYGGQVPGLDVFRYSPLAAALFAPTSLLPEAWMGVLWRLLSALIFILGLRWWLHELLPGRLTKAREAMLFLLILPLLIPNLYNGQVNPLMMGLLFAALASVRQRRYAVAGILIAIAFWLKLYPVAVGLLLMLAYPRRFSPGFLLAIGAGLVLPFVLQKPGYAWSEYQHWLEYLRMDNREANSFHYWLRDIRQLFLVLGMRIPAGTYPLVQVGAAAVFAICCLAAKWRGWPERDLLLFLTHLGCCWMTIFGPSTESPTWMILFPSLGTVLLLAWAENASIWLRGCLLLSYGIFLVTQISKWFTWSSWLADYGTQPLAGLLFLGCILWVGIARLISGKGSLERRDDSQPLAAAA